MVSLKWTIQIDSSFHRIGENYMSFADWWRGILNTLFELRNNYLCVLNKWKNIQFLWVLPLLALKVILLNESKNKKPFIWNKNLNTVILLWLPYTLLSASKSRKRKRKVPEASLVFPHEKWFLHYIASWLLRKHRKTLFINVSITKSVFSSVVGDFKAQLRN